jgi:hypothetical protein
LGRLGERSALPCVCAERRQGIDVHRAESRHDQTGLPGAVAAVSADGAAGSIYEAIHGRASTPEPSVIKQNGAGGATRAFTPGR